MLIEHHAATADFDHIAADANLPLGADREMEPGGPADEFTLRDLHRERQRPAHGHAPTAEIGRGAQGRTTTTGAGATTATRGP